MEKKQFQNYKFENLEVWKLGMEIVHEIYTVTKKFPKEELFALTSQLKRAGTSILLNIAEGTGQPTSKGFSVYIHRAKSSALECVAALKIAVQEKWIIADEIKPLSALLEKEYFKLIALEKSIR